MSEITLSLQRAGYLSGERPSRRTLKGDDRDRLARRHTHRDNVRVYVRRHAAGSRPLASAVDVDEMIVPIRPIAHLRSPANAGGCGVDGATIACVRNRIASRSIDSRGCQQHATGRRTPAAQKWQSATERQPADHDDRAPNASSTHPSQDASLPRRRNRPYRRPQ